jgi:hypothetical protein
MLRRVRARLLAIIVVGAVLLGGILLLPTIVQNTVCSPASLVKAHLEDLGFAPGSFEINPTAPIRAADAASTRGPAAFNQDGVYSNEQLKAYLASTDPNAAVAQGKINEILAGRTVSWVPVYFATAIDIVGNLGIDASGVFSANTMSGAGELIWFPVSQADCKVIDGLVLRAGCGNPATNVQPPCIREGSCTPPCPPGNTNSDCAPKDPKVSVTPPPGWTPLPLDPIEPTLPAPPAVPFDPTTPIVDDPGPSVPVPGASPAPTNEPAPSTDPGISPSPNPTPITDPDQ